jgi:hypothetical protein
MTISTVPLSDSLRELVDARLDTIDRMLMGRVERRDRLAIVENVEAQIDDMLRDRDPDTLTREDVLAMLGRLDPPEAYLQDLSESGAITSPQQRAGAPGARPVQRSSPPSRSGDARTARVSGVLGLVSLGMILIATLMFGMAEVVDSELLLLGGLFGSDFVMLIAGILAVVVGAYARKNGVWAIVGLVTGIVGIVLSLLLGVLLVLSI